MLKRKLLEILKRYDLYKWYHVSEYGLLVVFIYMHCRVMLLAQPYQTWYLLQGYCSVILIIL